MDKHSKSTDTELIHRLKQGDKIAADALIQRYFQRVVELANDHLKNCRINVTCGDDIAASVFESLWERANERRFDDAELQDSRELWRLLCKMVSFKVKDHLRRETAQKRGGGKLSELNNQPLPDGDETIAIHAVPEASLPELEKAIFLDEHERLMQILDDDTLRQIAMMRLEGYTVPEIAEAFQRSQRWAGRKIALIRARWKIELDSISE